jgi:hypothetical protein
VDITIVGSVIWACITLICLVCSVAAYANTVATKGDIKATKDDIRAIRTLLEQFATMGIQPTLKVSRDSDSDTQRRLELLEGAVLVLAEKVEGSSDRSDTNELLFTLPDRLAAAIQKNALSPLSYPVQLSSGQNGQQNLGEISVVPIERNRPSPKQQALVEWLNTNNWRDMTVREIAGLTGVSKSLVAETIKQLNG